MAVFTRINGDAAGVVQVDAGRSFANGAVINTGIAAPLQGYKITFAAGTGGNIAAELTTGGAVETMLRIIEGNVTVLAYQVDAGSGAASQLSVLCERSGWGTSSQTDVQALVAFINSQATLVGSGNIGATGSSTVSSVAATGIKLV